MFRVFVALLLFVGILTVVGLLVWGSKSNEGDDRLPPEVRALPRADRTHYIERVNAVRLLEAQLLDPTIAHSERWKEDAQKAVDKLYK